MEVYNILCREGRFFLHEHPQAAKSWNEVCVRRLLVKNGVQRVIGDQRAYGFKTWQEETMLASPQKNEFHDECSRIAPALRQRGPNSNEWQYHKHIRLEGGRTRVAQIQPVDLCRFILQSFKEQMEVYHEGQLLLAELEGRNGKH